MKMDESAFGVALDHHRRELQVHCYRMLGSYEDSEDLVQETFLRAWRGRDSFQGRASPRGTATRSALPQRRTEWAASLLTDEGQALVQRYIDAHENADMQLIAICCARMRAW